MLELGLDPWPAMQVYADWLEERGAKAAWLRAPRPLPGKWPLVEWIHSEKYYAWYFDTANTFQHVPEILPQALWEHLRRFAPVFHYRNPHHVRARYYRTYPEALAALTGALRRAR